MTTRLSSGDGEVLLLGTVQGLVREADRVRAAFARHGRAAVALGLSPEGVRSLVEFEGDPHVSLADEMADHDVVYSIALGAFGQVALPPPDLLRAARDASSRGWPLVGVDLPEEEYETLFTKRVSAWGFLKLGRIQRRLAKRPPKASDAASFALAWDAAMRKVKGLAEVEALRERRMAENVVELLRRERLPVILVVELPREAGVRAALMDLGFRVA